MCSDVTRYINVFCFLRKMMYSERTMTRKTLREKLMRHQPVVNIIIIYERRIKMPNIIFPTRFEKRAV